jgi:hypothetical protein
MNNNELNYNNNHNTRHKKNKNWQILIPAMTSCTAETAGMMTGKRPVGKLAQRMSSHVMAAVPQRTSDPSSRRPSKVSRAIHLPFACQAQQNVP